MARALVYQPYWTPSVAERFIDAWHRSDTTGATIEFDFTSDAGIAAQKLRTEKYDLALVGNANIGNMGHPEGKGVAEVAQEKGIPVIDCATFHMDKIPGVDKTLRDLKAEEAVRLMHEAMSAPAH